MTALPAFAARRAARPAALLLLLASLAACAPVPTSSGGPAVQRPQAGAGPSAPSPYANSPWNRKPSDKFDQQQVALSLPPAAVLADPGKLKGLGPADLRGLFGQPKLLRRDPPAEIWLYTGPACFLDLFLYEEDGGKKVAHYQFRSPQQLSQTECLKDLFANQRGDKV